MGDAKKTGSATVPERGVGGEGGFSVVELLVSLTLMALLGTSLLTVVFSGGEAFARIFDGRDAQNEARIALSYVTVRLRQNCVASAVSVVPSDSQAGGADVLRIDGAAGSAAGESLFIYFVEGAEGEPGRLVEKRSNAPGVDDPSGAVKIADIDGFEIGYTDGSRAKIRVAVSRGTGDAGIVNETTIALRGQ